MNELTATMPAPDAVSSQPVRTILCVDDEPFILTALQRLLRSSGHKVLTAEGGEAALTLMNSEPVDLLISDMRMPVMSGADLMQKVRARWPHITRLLLTGHSDVNATISAINDGQVHRYLTKPWSDAELLLTIRESFEHKFLEEEKQRLEALTNQQNAELKDLNANLESLVAERTQALEHANERLKRNYVNCIKTFSNLIELRGGQLTGHARRVGDLSLRIAKAMKLNETQTSDVLIASLLHDVGLIGLPDYVFTKVTARLAPSDMQQYRQHPINGEQALLGQDDMQGAAALIRSHHERHDGQGYPDGLAGEDIPIGARILALSDAYDDLQTGHLVSEKLSPHEARALIERGRATQFDPQVVDAFLTLFVPTVTASPPDQQAVLLKPDELEEGMVMARDFLSPQGVLLLASDHELTHDLIDRIRLFERRSGRPILLAVKQGKEHA
jgi:response regulator RpfG family c-di-GMP phosphodiesterase